jgi:hypothetical protein
MLPKIPTSTKEFEEGMERIRNDAIRQADKTVTGVGKEVSNQVAPTDFIAAMYAPTERKPQENTGETVGFGQQITPKPGELLGAIEGKPVEPGQKTQTESGKDQVLEFADVLTGGDEIPPTEPFTEQATMTSGQLIGHATGSIQTERVTPHMETASQQVIPTIDELTGLIGITSSESGQSASGQRQASDMGQAQKAELDRAGIDPSMQMSQQERTILTPEQKEKRAHQMLHEREHFKFGQLDDIGTLEEQVSKVRQQKEQEEKQKLEEEEEEKKRKEEEEKQKQQELPEPSTKPKPGDPNVAIGQSQKKTEMHRGTSG